MATVSFQPSSPGGKSTNLQIDGDSFQFTGTGITQFDVSPLSLSFGTQRVNTASASQPVTVTNNSGNSANVDVSIANSERLQRRRFQVRRRRTGGTACTVHVVFSPNAVGPQSGTLTVAGHDVSLTGRGTTNTIGVAPGSMGFGNQPVSTSSAPRTVTVTNTGSETLHLGAPTVGGNNPLQFAVSDTCFRPPRRSCRAISARSPSRSRRRSPGAMSAILQVNSDANSGDSTVNLTGNATPSAVTFSPAPVLFKRSHHAGTFSSPKTVTLTNRTSGPLTIARVHLGGQNPKSFRITAGNCAGRTLAPDATCTETVRFAPNEVGVKGASLVVNDDGPNGPHSVAVHRHRDLPP